jgi:hypothetical protein
MVNSLERPPSIVEDILVNYYRKNGKLTVASLMGYLNKGLSEGARCMLSPLIDRLERKISSISLAASTPEPEQGDKAGVAPP